MGRWALALAAFVAASVAAAVVLAVVLGVSMLWLEGDGKPSWLFAARERGFLGPSSPADLLLIALSVIAGLLGALITLSRRN